MLHTQLPSLYILEDKNKGRGVFTSEAIESGSIIELCPVIVLSANDTKIIHNTYLHDYYFIWDLEKNISAIALGYGSLYNHSENANAEFITDHESMMIKIMAKRNILANEEICLHYMSEHENTFKLWFDINSQSITRLLVQLKIQRKR